VEHIRHKEPEAQPIVIDHWSHDTEVGWASRLTPQYDPSPEARNIIIIDEAQSTYWDFGFWNSFLKSLYITSPNRVILFASYGSPHRRMSVEGTPFQIPDEQRVSLRPVDHRDEIPPVGLFLMREEFNDMVKKSATRFKADFLDYVFHITAGHTGAVKDLLRVVEADGVSLRINYGIH
jgi:hypothetical protein